MVRRKRGGEGLREEAGAVSGQRVRCVGKGGRGPEADAPERAPEAKREWPNRPASAPSANLPSRRCVLPSLLLRSRALAPASCHGGPFPSETRRAPPRRARSCPPFRVLLGFSIPFPARSSPLALHNHEHSDGKERRGGGGVRTNPELPEAQALPAGRAGPA